MNFTRGLWEVRYEFNVFCGNRIVAACGGHANNIDNERVRAENIANAELVAAAPEMYKVIEQLVCMTFDDEQFKRLMTEARQIYKKAKGEA